MICSNNSLTNLEHCPNSLIYLNCKNNSLTSLQYCPNSVTELYCYGNSLTSLEYCPNSITELYCYGNSLTSLEYCPNSLKYLNCLDNLLTNLEHCPNSVTNLYCYNNPLSLEYLNKSTQEIHKINTFKSYKLGIYKIHTIISAVKIQRLWKKYWYDELDEHGINRYCKFALNQARRDNIVI